MNQFLRSSRIYLLLLPFSILLHPMEKKQGMPRAFARLGAITNHLRPHFAQEEKEFKGEGFAVGTPVHTPEGPKPIQDLLIGDEVLSYDRFTDTYTTSTVARRRQKKFPNHIRIQVEDESLESNGDQKFLDEKRNWRHADELKAQDTLLNYQLEAVPLAELERVDKAKIFHGLSLVGAHNFVVGDQKLIVHNEPIMTIGTLATIFGAINAMSALHNIATMTLGAWEQRNGRALLPEDIQLRLSNMETAAAIRSVPIEALKAAPGRLSKETLDEIGKKFGFKTTLGDIPKDDLKIYLARLGVERSLIDIATETPKLDAAQVLTAEAAAAEKAVEVTVDSAKLATGGALASGIKTGLVAGSLQLGLGLLSGDVSSIGQAAATMGSTVGQVAGWAVGKEVIKQGGIAAGNKWAPELTKKALVFIPGVGLVISGAQATWTVYRFGRGVKNWFVGKSNPPAALQGQLTPAQIEGIRSDVKEWRQSEGGIRQAELLKGAVANLKNKHSNNKGGSNKGDGSSNGGSGSGGPEDPEKGPIRKALEELLEWSQFKKLGWVKRDLKNVRGSSTKLEVPKGKIPNAKTPLPRNTRFFSDDGKHKGEIEVWKGDQRGDHLGAWEILKDGTIGRMLKAAESWRKL